jgi:hypothetical protein
VGTRYADHVTPLYPQKLALSSPTGGGRSVGTVRSRTKSIELMLVKYKQILHTYLFNYLLLTYLHTPSSRVLLENQRSSQLVKKFPTFMEPDILLPHLQVPATCPYSEPALSSP